jgi:hypothetical protein
MNAAGFLTNARAFPKALAILKEALPPIDGPDGDTKGGGEFDVRKLFPQTLQNAAESRLYDPHLGQFISQDEV